MRHWAPPTAYGVRPPPARRDYTAPPPPRYGQVENFGGMLTAFAVGAAAGVLTWLELANVVDYLVDKITDVAKKLKELLASDDDAEAAEDEGAEDASNDDAEDAGDAYDLAFVELLASDDDSEAAEDRDAKDAEDASEDAEDEDTGDAYDLAFVEVLASDDDSEAAEDRDTEDAEDASEDEDDPASEIIDLTYPDGGGGGDDNN
ncbi:uncharacterized protein LOC130135320 [Syzygium oleosum]|uniref:uncharacterized protein LOC130135320 n=1 Tax=Syzygium oleosum TaxID=219896 RepID=UPI0024B8C904|nr:uncharacterized protein LOC130135320 [Syzygium oleosum]